VSLPMLSRLGGWEERASHSNETIWQCRFELLDELPEIVY
jgi:hypothetical protein